MAEISEKNSCVTLINVFTVEPSEQQKVVDMLVEATDSTMRHIPGFVSATVHKSKDGTRVANYAQWRSMADYEAMMHNPQALAHMHLIHAIVTYDAHLYDVVESVSL
jgi:heme-degrading monooxygenase HmoA